MSRAALKSGVSLVEKGQYPRALPHLDRAVAREPDFALGYAWRGLARYQTGSLRGALSDFENALRLDRGACSWIEPCLLEARRNLGLSGPIPQHVSLRWKDQGWGERYPAIVRMYEETEYRTAAEGLRAIMFRNVAPGDDFVERARRDKMTVRTIFHVRPYEGFSHRHDVVAAKEPGAWAHVVAARRAADADAAKRAYARGLGVKGHEVLGKLLGFPACCRRAFEKDFVLARIPDPLFESALRTKGAKRSGDTVRAAGHPEYNVLLRYFALRPVSWIPCAFDCAATKEAASRWLEAGRRVDRAAADGLLELLSQPVSWSCDLGRVRVETPLFAADAPSYVPDTPRHIHWSRR